MKPKSLTILRGQTLEQAAPDSLAMTCVAAEGFVVPANPSPYSLALLLSSNAEPSLWCSPGLPHTPYVPFAQGYQLALPELELTICFGILPWWQFPDFELPAGRRVLYVPFRGLLEGQWYDGPIAHYVPQGFLLSSFIPSGAPAKLCLPMEFVPPAEEVIPYIRSSFTNEKIKLMAMRTSAAFGLREYVQDLMGEGHHQIIIQNSDQTNLVLLCLLRIAFPDDSIELAALPEEKEEAVGWKRLCQNLDIFCGKDPRPSSIASTVALDQYRFLLPDAVSSLLMQSLNEHSSMIPHRLF